MVSDRQLKKNQITGRETGPKSEISLVLTRHRLKTRVSVKYQQSMTDVQMRLPHPNQDGFVTINFAKECPQNKKVQKLVVVPKFGHSGLQGNKIRDPVLVPDCNVIKY